MQVWEVADVPYSTRAQYGETFYRQGLRSVLGGRPPSFADPWNPISKVSVVATKFGILLFTYFLYTFRQILVNRIPVDVGPFCDAVERLCGSLILAYRFTTEHGILHGVTLPRSWFIGLSRSLPILDKNISYIPHFVNDTVELLRRIDTQQLNYHGSRLNPLSTSVYTARM